METPTRSTRAPVSRVACRGVIDVEDSTPSMNGRRLSFVRLDTATRSALGRASLEEKAEEALARANADGDRCANASGSRWRWRWRSSR